MADRELTVTNGVLRVCCAEERNLVLQPRDLLRPHVELRVCRVCGRRHVTMIAEPIRIGLTGTGIG